MNTLEHLRKVLPDNGLKIAAFFVEAKDNDGKVLLKPDGKPRTYTNHKYFEDVEALARFFRSPLNSNKPLYMAMGGFDPDKSFTQKVRDDGRKYWQFSRSADNTSHFRAFWVDIDCGKQKAETGDGYATQEIAMEKLYEFVETLGLPYPMLVSSGGGIHAYWALDKDLPAEHWYKIAKALDATIKYFGLLADPACTADKARILRPIGTMNHKYGTKVELIQDEPAVTVEEFYKPLLAYYKEHKEQISKYGYKEFQRVDKDDYRFNDRPRSVKHFLSRCQVGKETLIGKEPVPEPVWRGVISVVRLCDDGEKHLETLRKRCKTRFPDTTRFDEDRTAEKLSRFVTNNIGPYTCQMFQQECSHLCDGCPYAIAGSIRSPISLAEHYEEVQTPTFDLSTGEVKVPVVTEEDTATTVELEETTNDGSIPNPPYPFKRSAKGIVRIDKGVDGEKEILIFKGDLIPMMTRFVEFVDGEKQVMVKYLLRVGGQNAPYQELSIPMKDWYAADRLKQKLGSAGVSVADRNMNYLIEYLRAYQYEVGDKMKEVQQLQSFGWTADQSGFLIGDTLLTRQGRVTVQPHVALKNYATSFQTKGTLEDWQKLMQNISVYGSVEQQICILASLGSPLMEFTNYHGLWLHLVTKPGYGKTTTQEMMSGVWGDPSRLLMFAKDTANAIEERFGRFKNIVMCIDETSNVDPHSMSDLVLNVTNGRQKKRLDTNMRERADSLTWKMLVMSSGNFSMLDRMNTVKEDITAEVSRILEIKLPKPTLSVSDGEREIKTPIRQNYGVAGRYFIEKLLNVDPSVIRNLVETAIKKIDSIVHAESDERFWLTGCAVIYSAGVLAKKMGLVDWDMDKIFDRLCVIIKEAQLSRTNFDFNAVDVLASFLNENIRNTAVVVNGPQEGTIMMKLQPTGQLNVRYEESEGMLYIRTQALKEYCGKRGTGLQTVVNSLNDKRLLEKRTHQMIMSRGLPITTARTTVLVVRVDQATKITLDAIVEANDEK